jgi:hypothetical protein
MDTSSLTYTLIHPTKFFQNVIQMSTDFIECANVHGHIHTHCTLALILSFQHFTTSIFPWCVGDYPSFSPYGLFIFIHSYSRTILPAIGRSQSQNDTHETQKFHMNAFDHSSFINNQGANTYVHPNLVFSNTYTIKLEMLEGPPSSMGNPLSFLYENMHFLESIPCNMLSMRKKNSNHSLIGPCIHDI